MKLILRPHTNTDEEINLGQKVGFSSIHGVSALSVTANLNGVTPLSAVLQHLKIDKKIVRKLVETTNINGHVKLVQTWPNLILMPPTRAEMGRNRDIEFYTIQLIKICNAENFKNLHFTHYGFINGVFQGWEIRKILSIFLNPLIYTTLETVYWEIDSRFVDEMKNLYRDVNINCNNSSAYPEEYSTSESEKQNRELRECLKIVRDLEKKAQNNNRI
jgi:hypothetical protein